MRSAWALIRVTFLTAASYRLSMLISIAGLALQIVPTYYIGKTLDPFMAPNIKGQGGDYFGFLVMGTIAYLLLAAAVDSLPRALERGISTGTLELIFSTPSPVPALLVGLTGYEILFATTRAIVVLTAATIFGFHPHWSSIPIAMGILALIVVTYFGVGMIAGGMIIAYRRTASLQTIAIVASAMLGGVTYPPSMVPSWIGRFSELIPMTYGLRAVRRLVIDGSPV
ncbi:MAG: type transporter, partial [Gemmatimonadetes bacterium]|nr:type transporter [Gemmatimonadota bacterium]